MQKEKLSALMDGEIADNVFLNSLSNDQTLRNSWQGYHLIRDTLRGDIGEVVHLNMADRIAAALDKEPVLLVPGRVPESQPEPHSWQAMGFWQKIRPWATQLTQVGVAACVSLAVIVGVQQYNQSQEVQGFDAPVLNTLPIGGQASPVSFGVPSEASGGQMQQLQEQRKRINAMLQDYELQRRLHAEQLQVEPKSASTSNQAETTQSLGMHQQ